MQLLRPCRPAIRGGRAAFADARSAPWRSCGNNSCVLPHPVRGAALAGTRFCVRSRGRLAAASGSGEAVADTDSWESVFEQAEQEREGPVVPAAAEAPRWSNRAFLVGVAVKQQPRAAGGTLGIEASLDELAHLANTAGLQVCGRTHQNLDVPDSRFYVGKGKLHELLEQARGLDVDTLLFDDELKPSQARNVEREAAELGLEFRCCDRVELILDICARPRARNRACAACGPGCFGALTLPTLPHLLSLLSSPARRHAGGLPSNAASAGRVSDAPAYAALDALGATERRRGPGKRHGRVAARN